MARTYYNNRRFVKLDFISYYTEDWFIRQPLYHEFTGETLTASTKQDGTVVYSNDEHFNWVYYEPADLGLGLDVPAVISDGTGVINPANYRIHYRYGEVTFVGYNPTGTVTADFAKHLYVVSTSEDDYFSFRDSPYSYVTIQKLTIREEGLQLGGGVTQYADFIVEINSYDDTRASARARTDECTEIVKRGLNKVEMLDYTDAFPLDFYGDIDPTYDRVAQRFNDMKLTYSLLENTVMDTELPNFDDTREHARSQLMFTYAMVADTNDAI